MQKFLLGPTTNWHEKVKDLEIIEPGDLVFVSHQGHNILSGILLEKLGLSYILGKEEKFKYKFAKLIPNGTSWVMEVSFFSFVPSDVVEVFKPKKK